MVKAKYFSTLFGIVRDDDRWATRGKSIYLLLNVFLPKDDFAKDPNKTNTSRRMRCQKDSLTRQKARKPAIRSICLVSRLTPLNRVNVM